MASSEQDKLCVKVNTTPLVFLFLRPPPPSLPVTVETRGCHHQLPSQTSLSQDEFPSKHKGFQLTSTSRAVASFPH